jgi:UPF0176 protein
MALHNRISKEELRKLAEKEQVPRITFSFYKYTPLNELEKFRNDLYRELEALKVWGRIYIASEGVNAQASVPHNQFEQMRSFIYSFPCFNGVRINVAVENQGNSFWMLKVKIRSKIVADGITDQTFDMSRSGQYLDAASFNQLTDNPATLIVDMRNHYEYEIGHFENARILPSDTFRQQLPMAVESLQDHKDKPIVMYCTGGIRCEKASAYLIHHGFRNVYHLEGGIIEYTRKVAAEGLVSKFRGKNFVFDGRLGERISPEIISSCHQCGEPSDTHTNCRNPACHLLFIQCHHCNQKYQGCCSKVCLETLLMPDEERKQMRKERGKDQTSFGKSIKRIRPDAGRLLSEQRSKHS